MPERAKFTSVTLFVVLTLVITSSVTPVFADAALEQNVQVEPLRFDVTDNNAVKTIKSLTVEEAIQRVLSANLQLQAAEYEVQAMAAQGRQLALRPNPELAVEFEEFAGSGDYSGTDSLQATVSVSQLIERGGKRSHRQQRAEQQNRVAEQSLAVTRSGLINQTRERFVAVLVSSQQLDLAKKQLAQAEAVLEIVREGVDAGKKAPVEVLRFKSLATNAQLRFQAAQTLLTNRRLQLASSWNSNVDDFGVVDGELGLLPQLPAWAQLEQRLASAPLLGLSQQQQQLAETELALEKANSVNNFTLELGVKNDRSNDDVALMAGFSIPLALFDRNQGAIAAANSRVSQAEAEAKALQQQLRQQLLMTYQRAQLSHQELQSITTQLLPTAQAVFDALSFGYSQGKFGVIEVLDAQGRLFDSEDRYIEALTRYHQQFNELSRLLGDELAENRG